MSVYDDVAALQTQVAALETTIASMQAANALITGTAIATNEKLNGKTVYCKVVDVGALPNASNKLIASGLTMGDIEIVRVEGIAQNAAGTTIPIPNPTPATNYTVGCFITAAGNIQLDAVIDRSEYTGIVRVYYIMKNEA